MHFTRVIVGVVCILHVCFILTKSDDEVDAALLIGFEDGGFFYGPWIKLVCIAKGKAANSALVFNKAKKAKKLIYYYGPEDKSYNPDVLIIRNERYWNEYNLFNTVVGKYGLLDFRWEGLENFFVNSGIGTKLNAPSEEFWTMNLSFKANKDAYIYLCEKEYYQLYSCIWIIFGAKNNEWSGIREIYNGDKLKEEKEKVPINVNQWNHVTLTVTKKRVQFQFGTLNLSMEKKFYINYLIFRTVDKNPKSLNWKIHKRKFFGTMVRDSTLTSEWFSVKENRLCLSFFYYIPSGVQNAKLIINVYDNYSGSLVMDPEYITDNEEDETKGWRRFEKTFNLVPHSGYLIMKITATFDSVLPNRNSYYDVFAVDDIRLCSPEGNVHTLEASISSRDYADLPTCQLLQFSDNELTAREPVNYNLGCGTRDLPSNCSRTCKSSFEGYHEDCTKVNICVLRNGSTICACNRGHNTPQCLKCSSGWYGDGCSEKCGECSNGEACNWDSGVCPRKCKDGYVPPYCDKTYPKLNIAPSVVGASPTTLTFIVDFRNISGYGMPTEYEIQYKEANLPHDLRWLSAGKQRVEYKPVNITLGPLGVLKKYMLRVILYVEEGSYEGDDVPIFEGTTTCEDIQVEEPVPYKTSIQVRLTKKNDKLACPSNYFTVELEESDGKITKLNFTGTSNLTFQSLEPYKEYNVKVVRLKSNVIFERNVSTLQAAPTVPLNLRAVSTYTNKTNITWGNPEKPNGRLIKFEVLLEVKKTWLMKGKVQNMSVDHNVSEESLNYSRVVNGLSPSTLYLVSVFGVTVEPGPEAKLNLQTPLAEPVYTETLASVEESWTDSTVEITLPPASEYLTNTSAYFVMVGCKSCLEGRESKIPVLNETLWNELVNHSRLNEYDNIWIAGEVEPEFSETNFTVGNNTNSIGYFSGKEYVNRPLKVKTDYKIVVVVVNQQEDNRTFATLELPQSIFLLPDPRNYVADDSGVNYGLLVFFLLLLIIVPILGYFIYKRRYTLPSLSRSKLAIQLTHQKVEDDSYVLKPPAPDPDPQSETEELFDEPQPLPPERHSCRVRITELESYVMKGISSGELYKQYMMFPRGQTQPWAYGKLPLNKPKNRYGNLVAYDHSRVILEELPGVEHSDYINANYIDGYKTKKMYIATQGPKPNTVDDFWRMVWQEQVHIISMLANVLENGKKKCEHYWPDCGKETTYGNVTIVTENEQVYADFTLRNLKITCQGKERKVSHLHFTSWPDHGVPFYPQSVAGYLKKLLAMPKGPGPVLVHCSAGVGRTGTIVLADICLRMAAAERAVDVLRYLQSIREQRPNMVDNFEQFKLVHLVLIECLVEEQTSYSCNGLAKHITHIKEAGYLVKQFERLEELRLQNQVLQPSNAQSKTQANESPLLHKNRSQDIVPGRSGRVFLSRNAVPDNTSDYINAVYVDGFRIRDQFIVTQYPLPSTVGDFWRMVVEKNISLIVMLNDFNASETVPEFRPMSDESIMPVPHLKIKLKQKSHAQLWSLMKFQITDSSSSVGASQHQVVRMIQLTGWSAECELPQEPGILIQLWQEVETHYCGKGPTLIMCLDGATASGLFIASSFVIEKIKLEQQCDVCHAVRTIRQNRKHFIQSQEQFEFLYDVALNYLEAFSIYSNFD